MKSLIIVMCILAVATVVYGFDPERSQKFQGTSYACEKENKDKDDSHAATLYCKVKRDGKVIKTNNEVDFDEALKLIEDLVSNTEIKERTLQEFRDCYFQAVRNDERRQICENHASPIVRCFMKIKHAFDTAK